jgi:PilZ domain
MRPTAQHMMGAKSVEVTDGDSAPTVRHHIRYPLRASAAFKWFGLDGAQCQGKGSSSDISEGGAYIVTRNCPPLRATIDLVIRFSSVLGVSRSYRLEMRGRVVRVEPLLHSKESWGFAVAATQPVLRELDDAGDGSERPN